MEVFMTGFSYVNLATQTAFGVARTHCSEEGRRALRAQWSVENGIPSDILDRIESWFQVMDFTGNINTVRLLNERQYTQLEGFLFCLRRDLLGPNYLDHAQNLNLTEFILTYLSQEPLPAQIAHSRGLIGVIELAARFGYEDPLERLLTRAAEVRPEDAQMGINWALQVAARGGQGAIVERLLTRPEAERPRPDQEGVNRALQGAAYGGHWAIVERLLTRPEAEGPRPDQAGVNLALRWAAQGGRG